MYKQGCWCLGIGILAMLLSSCLSEVWTGASLVYDRHNVYRKWDDFQLGANGNRALYRDNLFKRDDCAIDLAVFHGDFLLAGRVPTLALREEAYERVHELREYRRLFNQLEVSRKPEDALQDRWITAKIRSQIFADSSLDPHMFKVVTSMQIVYLMGDVFPADGARVIQIARSCVGVKRVVTLFKYYNLSDHPAESLSMDKKKA